MIATTNGLVLAKKQILLTSVFEHATGLMFKRRLNDTGLVFLLGKESYCSVTNLFVFQTIDVLWLDKRRVVIKKKTVKPFTPHVAGCRGTAYLIELAKGAAKQVRIGDKIIWKSKDI